MSVTIIYKSEDKSGRVQEKKGPVGIIDRLVVQILNTFYIYKLS